MDREEIMERLADYFELEDVDFDIDSYDWQAGYYIGDGRKFLCLAEVVKFIESYIL